VNALKNLLILTVLGAVGYGIYVSLTTSNVESVLPAGVAPSWPMAPKVEMPTAKSSTASGGPLALGPSAALPTSATTLGTPSAPPLAPPSAPPLVATPTEATTPTTAPTATPLSPYPSSGSATSAAPSSVASLGPSNPFAPVSTASAPTSAPPVAAPSSPSPAVTLGAPVAPDTVGASASPADVVRNLMPPPEVAAASTTPVIDPNDALLRSKFTAFMDAVQRKLDEGKLAEAHLALSTLYGNPDLPAEQSRQITELLDQLAGTVIYSRQHCLEPAYVTQPGDTLDRVAQKCNISWQLLARINGLMPPGASNADAATKDQPLPVGKELKVVRGPFEAIVRLDKHELTLMLQNRYAGRFPIGVGRDQPKLDGNYMVRDKSVNPAYYGPDGVNVAAGDPKNPLGASWIGLTDRIGIHGAADPKAIGRDDNRGAICVGQRDLEDLYGILTVGSRVTIVR
jgi:hypothetical protein